MFKIILKIVCQKLSNLQVVKLCHEHHHLTRHLQRRRRVTVLPCRAVLQKNNIFYGFCKFDALDIKKTSYGSSAFEIFGDSFRIVFNYFFQHQQ
jgi:hypothetical protein